MQHESYAPLHSTPLPSTMADQRTKRPTPPPHFFQPLLPSFSTSFSIPLAFYKKYLEGAGCGRAELRSRGRRRGWKVGLVGRRIVDGWREFAEEHELRVGYFLVFRYDGDMAFDVSVFDESQCEIEYQQLDQGQDVDMAEDDDGMEDLVKGEDGELKMDLGHTRIHAGQKEDEVPKPASVAQPGTYFVRTSTQPSLDRSQLFVGTKFARMYDLANKCGRIILRNSEGKAWVATLKHGGSNSERFFITTGWTEFALANGLLPGRVFKLEIVKAETKLLNLKLTKRITRDDIEH